MYTAYAVSISLVTHSTSCNGYKQTGMSKMSLGLFKLLLVGISLGLSSSNDQDQKKIWATVDANLPDFLTRNQRRDIWEDYWDKDRVYKHLAKIMNDQELAEKIKMALTQ
ncbi:hypothetical protein Btru_062729 [Bulinus truncatus]|nr:hypothetical protein Btru_062729 [Bulinus truncatus]